MSVHTSTAERPRKATRAAAASPDAGASPNWEDLLAILDEYLPPASSLARQQREAGGTVEQFLELFKRSAEDAKLSAGLREVFALASDHDLNLTQEEIEFALDKLKHDADAPDVVDEIGAKRTARTAFDEARAALVAQRQWLIDNPSADTPEEYFAAVRSVLETPAPDAEALAYKLGVFSHDAHVITRQGAFFDEIAGKFPADAVAILSAGDNRGEIDDARSLLSIYEDIHRLGRPGAAHPTPTTDALPGRSAWDNAKAAYDAIWLSGTDRAAPADFVAMQHEMLAMPAPDVRAAAWKLAQIYCVFLDGPGDMENPAEHEDMERLRPEAQLMLGLLRDLIRLSADRTAPAAASPQDIEIWNKARDATHAAFERHATTEDENDYTALCRAQEYWESLTPPGIEAFAEVMGYALDHFGPLGLTCQSANCPRSMRDLLDSTHVGDRIAGRFYLHALRMAGRDSPALNVIPLTGLRPPFDPSAVDVDEDYAAAWERHHVTAKPYPGAVKSLQAMLDDARAWVEAGITDEDTASRHLIEARIEDEIRRIPCVSDEVALAHARIIARDVSTGERFAAAVSFEDLAEGVLRHYGEVF